MISSNEKIYSSMFERSDLIRSSLETGQHTYLFDLIPKEEEKCTAEERLEARLLLLEKSIEAIQAFRARKFSSFDALVGDNACQIRALMIALLSKQRIFEELDDFETRANEKLSQALALKAALEGFDQDKFQKIKEAKKILNPLKEQNILLAKRKVLEIEKLKSLDRNDKLERLADINAQFKAKFQEISQKKEPILKEIESIEEEADLQKIQIVESSILDVSLNRKIQTLVTSFLLTEAKTWRFGIDAINNRYEYKNQYNARRLTKEYPLAAKYVNDLIQIAKRALNHLSVIFLQGEAEKLLADEYEGIRKIIAEPRLINKSNGYQYEFPFNIMTKVIFERAREEKIPIFLKIRTLEQHPLDPESYCAKILFTGGGTGNIGYHWQTYATAEEQAKLEGIVVEAFSSASERELSDKGFQEQIIRRAGGILGLIDKNTLLHRQFTALGEENPPAIYEILDISTPQMSELKSRFDNAKEIGGFTKDNPALCCIDHIYFDDLSETCQLGTGG